MSGFSKWRPLHHYAELTYVNVRIHARHLHHLDGQNLITLNTKDIM